MELHVLSCSPPDFATTATEGLPSAGAALETFGQAIVQGQETAHNMKTRDLARSAQNEPAQTTPMIF